MNPIKTRNKRGIAAAVAVAALGAALFTHFYVRAAAAPSPDAAYKGIKNCKMCHSDNFEAWSKLKHARAFELLVAVGKQNAKECLPCHTTGYGKKGGYVDEATTPDLKGVQCEACHGPGENHNGDPKGIVKAMPASKCGECHMALNIH